MGKYKGKTLDHVSKDIDYSNWLISQKWFNERYATLSEELSKLINNRKPTIRNSKDIIVYTDGACSNNGLEDRKIVGGCGIYFSKRNEIEINNISKKLKDVYMHFSMSKYYESIDTNNKAELMAICLALDICREYNRKVILYTDSEYSIKAIYEWYPTWVKKGIVEKKKNYELIMKIIEYTNNMNINMIHIRAHTGLKDENSIGNYYADNLACMATK